MMEEKDHVPGYRAWSSKTGCLTWQLQILAEQEGLRAGSGNEGEPVSHLEKL